MIVAHLDGVKAWVFNRNVGNVQGVRARHFGSVVIGSESHHKSTDTRLLKTCNVDSNVGLSSDWTMVWRDILHLDLFVVVEDLRETRDDSTSINCQLDMVEVLGVLIFAL